MRILAAALLVCLALPVTAAERSFGTPKMTLVRDSWGLGLNCISLDGIPGAGLMLFAATCFAHLAITNCHGPAIYLVRIGWCCSLAGIFGAAARARKTRPTVAFGLLAR